MLDVNLIRKQFPILYTRNDSGQPLAYLDNAATTQKPWIVIESINQFYRTQNANIHRGIYELAYQATQAYELARQQVALFINASQPQEVIFCRGTTEAVNMVAHGWGQHLRAEDEVLVTTQEHHSNFVPWQTVCQRKGAGFRVVDLQENGAIDTQKLAAALTPRTRMLAITHISNTLGIINPLKEIVALARQNGTLIFVDGAQSIAYDTVDVQDLDCDFFAFSGHKAFGPMGIGVLYGKYQHLESMNPYQQGGSMIYEVSTPKTIFKEPPQRFEAGTPPVAEAIALGVALEFITKTGIRKIKEHTNQIREYARQQLKELQDLQIMGPDTPTSGIISFNIKDIHPHDVATILGEAGVAVRAGHHCTQPLMQHFGIAGTVRASFSIYNHREEVDQMVRALATVKQIMT